MQLRLLRLITLILFVWGVVSAIKITDLEYRVHDLEGQIDIQIRRSQHIQDRLEDVYSNLMKHVVYIKHPPMQKLPVKP